MINDLAKAVRRWTLSLAAECLVIGVRLELLNLPQAENKN